MHFLHILLVIALLTSSGASTARTGIAPLMDIQWIVQLNTLDGCANCHCRVKSALRTDRTHEGWLTFGVVRPQGDGGWQAVDASVHCGQGHFEPALPKVLNTIGKPYLASALRARASVDSRDRIHLEIEWSTRRLASGDAADSPGDGGEEHHRRFVLRSGDPMVLPLFVAGVEEREAFGVHEVILNMRVWRSGNRRDTRYGSLSVTGDVPGAAVYLDEGLVGRLPGSGALLIDPVARGTHTVALRDFSGRQTRQKVRIRKNKVSSVELHVLNLDGPGAGGLQALGPNPQGFEEFWRARDRVPVVLIPAGPFLMGSAKDKGDPIERPQHEVDQPAFLADKLEVSWRQFREFAIATNKTMPPAPLWGHVEAQPASFILLDEAEAYCDWAGGRLPTEAQWEKAARGTDGRVYPWGDEWEASRCNTISGGKHQPSPVGSHPACLSPYGMLDMAGSVQEWVANRFYPYDASQKTHSEAIRYAAHVMRGGGWMSQPNWARTSHRHRRSPDSRLMDHGFRCVQEAPGSER